jgi:hypothetical protein
MFSDPIFDQLEEALTDALDGMAEVDGHDVGQAEANIFIFTEDPSTTFKIVQQMLQELNLLSSTKAAYRDLNEEDFTCLWPEGMNQFRVG